MRASLQVQSRIRTPANRTTVHSIYVSYKKAIPLGHTLYDEYLSTLGTEV